MGRTHRRWLLIPAMLVLCIGIIGASHRFGRRGIVGLIQDEIALLFETVEELSEASYEHDEQIELIVLHIRDMKASLCDIHDTEPLPDFCASPCVIGICDTVIEPDPCEANPGECGNNGGGG